MTEMQTCRTCGEARAVDAYRLLPSGNRAGICTPCNRSNTAAWKERQKASQEAERREKLAQLQRLKEEREAAAAAAMAARAAAAARRKADKTAQQAAAAALAAEHVALREAARQRREEREAALRDDIWSAMRRGRYRRAATAVQPHRTGAYTIQLKHERGFITAAELACRCAEREATYRAAKSCKTFEAAAAAVRILEKGTTTLERTREVRRLWWTDQPRLPLEVLQGPAEDLKADLWEEALGDWAPAWLGTAPSSWPVSLAA